jgi:hypothetical protein
VDDFSSDQQYWVTGTYPGEYADTIYTIDAGVYSWTVSSHKTASERVWPQMDTVNDFTVSVDAKQSSSNADDCDYGLMFRQDDGTLLSFALSDLQYSVYSFDKTNGWIKIIPETTSNDIMPGSYNRLVVTRVNDHYTFYANGTELTNLDYSTISSGIPGLNIDVFDANKTCTFEYDNFKVTVPVNGVATPESIDQAPTPAMPYSFFDDFSDLHNGWSTGNFSNNFSTVNYQLEGGVYQWTIDSLDSANRRAWPNMDLLTDFTSTLDARQKSINADDCDYGLIYIQPDDGTFLAFDLSNKYYGVFFHDKSDNWNDVIPWTTNDALAPGAMNTIKVTASGGLYDFYVNGVKLVELTDNDMAKGEIGMNVDAFYANKSCTFEFDNLNVTSP